MLSEICKELNNWFDRNQPKTYGKIEIASGKITNEDFTDAIKVNQYFRIVGSLFNDGVYKYTPSLELTDEVFEGSIWLMAIPKEVVNLSDEIDAWISKYSDVIDSPYTSESFGGYSYSKASSDNSGSISWQKTFAAKLNLWRKI